jgi:hypothetical protein
LKVLFVLTGFIEEALRMMEKLYERLRKNELFENVDLTEDNEIVIHTGCLHEGQDELVFHVIDKDGDFVLTDNGQTLERLDAIFELTEPDVVKNIKASTDYYGIGMKKMKLVLPMNLVEDFTEAYLRMFFCVGFLRTMKLFYV